MMINYASTMLNPRSHAFLNPVDALKPQYVS